MFDRRTELGRVSDFMLFDKKNKVYGFALAGGADTGQCVQGLQAYEQSTRPRFFQRGNAQNIQYTVLSSQLACLLIFDAPASVFVARQQFCPRFPANFN